MKKRFLIILVALLWCNVGFAKILNIDNKLRLEPPQHHKILNLKEEDMSDLDIFSGSYQFFEHLNPKIFLVAPKNMTDLIESYLRGEDPTNMKFIGPFLKKIEKKTSSGNFISNSWAQKEIKKLLKKAKIDFWNYVLVMEENINDIGVVVEGYDPKEILDMNNSELREFKEELKEDLFGETEDGKTYINGPSKYILKKFEIEKNKANEVFVFFEAKYFMAVNEDISVNGNYNVLAAFTNNYSYIILSECLLACSNHTRQFNKMIKTTISNNTKISNSGQTDLVKQLKALNDLYESGVLTEEEFKKAKKKLLN
jgi:hypothetical protein